MSLPDPEIPTVDIPMGVEPPETAADEAPMDIEDIEPSTDVAMEMVVFRCPIQVWEGAGWRLGVP